MWVLPKLSLDRVLGLWGVGAILRIWAMPIAALSLGVPGASAQIVPDQTLGTEGSTVRSLDATNIRLEGGASRGVNLFHSFREFNVGEGQQVYFANPMGIEAILGRVTGGNLSNIQGTLGVDGGASLFLLNPNGFVFGPGARLDIRGSFLASGGDRFSFPDGQEFSAVNPGAAPLLTLNVQPGLQLGRGSAAFTGAIAAQGNLSVGGDLTLVGQSVSARDAIASATQLNAGGQLTIQGDQSVDLSLLSHPDSGLVSGGDMVLRSDSPVIGDAQYSSGGNFRVEGLNGQPGRLISPNDPVFRVAGDFTLADYTGASLHVLAGGSVTIPSVTITGVGVPASSLIEAVPLSRALPDGTTVVQVNGVARPTLDVRAGTTAFGTPTQGSGAATNANIAIDRITVNQPNGLVLLTNQYQPNALPGAITVKTIDTRSPGGSGTVVLDSRGDIALQPFGVIRTNGQVSSAGTGGAAGDVALVAAGGITLGERSVIQARGSGTGAGGDVTLLGNSLTLNNRSQIETSTYGSGRGGDIAVDVRDGVVLRGTNTRIASLVEAGGTGQGGNIRVNASNLTIGNGAGIFAGVRGQGAGGNITVDVPGTVAIDGVGGGSNSAIMNALYAGASGTSGDIVLRAGALRLTDGGLITTEAGEGALGQGGNINAAIQGETFISGRPVDKTLPDAGGPPTSGSGKVDVFFLADNTGSMGGVIRSVQNNSNRILNDMAGGDLRFASYDIGYGVGSYTVDPNARQTNARRAYVLGQSITTDNNLAETAIQAWRASAGGTETHFFALHQVATSGQATSTGVSTGFDTGWRDGANRIIVWFGDEPSSENTVTQAEAANVLQSNNIRVIAINTRGPRQGIDINGQASAIVTATGGILRNRIDTAGITDLLLNAIDETLLPDYASVGTHNCIPDCTTPSGFNAGASGGGSNTVATGGNIRLLTPQLTLSDRAEIRSFVFGSGSTGSIEITAPIFEASNLSGVTSIGGGLNAKTSNITINSSERLKLESGSNIASTIFGSGQSGNLTLNVGQLILDSGQLGTIAFGDVQAGDMSINADNIRLAQFSNITTGGIGAAQAGRLSINANNLSLNAGSTISAANTDVRSLTQSNDALIAELQRIYGPKAVAPLVAFLQSVTDVTSIASQGLPQGNAAPLTITISQTTTLQDAILSTRANGAASGADLRLQTGTLNAAGSSIDSKSEGTGIAGGITVKADDRLFLNNADISASAAQSGGGDINLSADNIFLRNGSLISTSVFSSTGGGGNITINSPTFVAIEDSDILANAEDGRGGDIFIQSPAFLASLFSSSKATPVGRNPGSFDRFRGNGRVDISADAASGQSGTVQFPNVDPARGLTQLPEGLPDRSDRIDRSCSRNDTSASASFQIIGSGGLPESPLETRNTTLDLTEWATEKVGSVNAERGREGGKVGSRNAERGSREVGREPASSLPRSAFSVHTFPQEATTWRINKAGHVELMAEAPVPPPELKPCPTEPEIKAASLAQSPSP